MKYRVIRSFLNYKVGDIIKEKTEFSEEDNALSKDAIEALEDTGFLEKKTFTPFLVHARLFCKSDGTYLNNEIFEDARGFSEGRAAVKQNRKWYFIKENGEKLNNELYDDVGDFHFGRAWVVQNGRQFFIKENGEKLNNEVYETACTFSENIASVEQNGTWHYIKRNGEKLNDDVYFSATSFKNGKAEVQTKEYGKTRFIDTFGKIIS